MTDSIVEENLKQGTPQEIWDAEISDQIEGFATDISINHGTRVDFKINVNADPGEEVPYHVEIYRLGYYGGDGARLVQTIEGLTGTAQPDPLTDVATGLVDAGNWSVSTGWDVPADAVSGVYLVKLVRDDNGATNQIPFIVRDDDGPKSDILLQTSDTTWHAYNGWAGNNGQVGGNFYGDPSGTINHPDVEDPGLGAQDRAYAVSYNRPFLTRDGGGAASGAQDYLFGADFAAIYWLEKNGYDVSYISGVDTDRLGAEYLEGHGAFISVGHDEYWSGQQRVNVEEARDSGVNLLFWSGNEVYWKVRYEDAISADGTPYRTLVCYKETWANGDPNAGPEDYANIDPADDWTGTWRDVRFVDAVDEDGNYIAGGSRLDLLSGNSPNCNCVTGAGAENALTGQLFGPDGTGQFGAALDVPAALAGLRVWRDTTLAGVGQDDIAEGILGYEWDVAPDDASRPAGLIKLSETVDVPWSGILIDQGNEVQPGVATHNLTLYRAESGALVFGAGTVFWSWGLSDQHDSSPYGAEIANVDLQQFTINMFADMGIQPGVSDAILASQGLARALSSSDFAPATTTLNLPDEMHAFQMITITGTATDDDGNPLTEDGMVALVEVSLDGGATWHAAHGTTNWTFNWRPASEGSYTIMARAIDDSLNITNIVATEQTVTVEAAVPPDTFSLFDGLNPGAGAVDNNDNTSLELGMRFTADRAGEIIELKYYRTSNDATDTDVREGHLWRADGTLLATVTFTSTPGETGWQVATLDTPVTIQAGVEYIVSYHTEDHYLATNGFFAPSNEVAFDGIDNDAFSDPFGVLSAPQNSVAGDIGTNGNGIYSVGSTPSMPTQTYQSSNYWTDVTFDPFDSLPPNTAPTITSNGGADSVEIQLPENTQLVLTYAAFDPESPPQTLTYSLSGEDMTLFQIVGNQLRFLLAPDYENLPAEGATPGYQVTLTVDDGNGGTDSQDISITVTDADESGITGSTIFANDEAPTNSVDSSSDPTNYELGVKFTSSQDGEITALRYFRAAGDADDVDTRTLHLWDANGQLLATATVESGTGESGWQVATLPTPVAITAGAIYVVSYSYFYDDDGNPATLDSYAASGGYFNDAHIGPDGVLTGVDSDENGGNGVFAAGGPGSFPNQSYNASNYWVDVVFSSSAGPNENPEITSNGGGDTAAVTIDENTTLVTTVTATDADSPTLTYSIVGGEDAALFTIDPVTGALSFIAAPDYEALPAAGATAGYQVTVQVSDGEGGFDTQDITVDVADVLEVVGPDFGGQQIQLQFIFGTAPDELFPSDGATQTVTVDATPGTIEVANLPFPDANTIGNGQYGLASVDVGATTIRIEFPLDPAIFGDTALVNFATAESKPYNGVLITDSANNLPPILGVTILGQGGFQVPLDVSNLTVTGNSIFLNVAGNARLVDSDPDTDGIQSSHVTLLVNFNNAEIGGTTTGGVTEDLNVVANEISTSGLLTIVDIDEGQAQFVAQTSVAGSNGYGTFTLGSDGQWTYVADNTQAAIQDLAQGEFFTDSFVATSLDGSDSQTVTVTIHGTNEVNGVPVANADILAATEDTVITFAAADLLGNDTDVENDPLSIVSVTSGTGGTAALNPDGSVTFTPNADFNGVADFTYTVSDGTDESAPATVTVNVAAVNDVPVSNANVLTATSGRPRIYSAAELLWNDTDAENDPLSIISVMSGIGGIALLNSNGSVSFTPDTNFIGAANFTYTVSDGTDQSAPATVTVDVGSEPGAGSTGAGRTGTSNNGAPSGSHRIDGTSGRDHLVSSGASEILKGHNGHDVLKGRGGHDTLLGGNHNDRLYGDSGNDKIYGGNGGDICKGGSGNDLIKGNDGSDRIYGNAGNDTLIGGRGADRIFGSSGNDKIYAGAGSDIASGGRGHDLIKGNDGSDRLYGNSGNDTLIGGDGSDRVYGGSGNDKISGGAGNDQLKGDSGNDLIKGDDGADTLWGGDGNDTLLGGAGDDSLDGGSGDDRLEGGAGADVLEGGEGRDVFVYNAATEGGDTIRNFIVADDTLYISASGFGGGLIAGQTLDDQTFIAGASPIASAAALGTFLYDTDTHDLFWDHDGAGGDDAVQLVHFDTAVNLKANDFDIVA